MLKEKIPMSPALCQWFKAVFSFCACLPYRAQKFAALRAGSFSRLGATYMRIDGATTPAIDKSPCKRAPSQTRIESGFKMTAASIYLG